MSPTHQRQHADDTPCRPRDGSSAIVQPHHVLRAGTVGGPREVQRGRYDRGMRQVTALGLAIGWMAIAFLLVRIMTSGEFRDVGFVLHHAPVVLALGSAIIPATAGIGLWSLLGTSTRRLAASMAWSVVTGLFGAALRVWNDHDSGLLIVALSAGLALLAGIARRSLRSQL